MSSAARVASIPAASHGDCYDCHRQSLNLYSGNLVQTGGTASLLAVPVYPLLPNWVIYNRIANSTHHSTPFTINLMRVSTLRQSCAKLSLGKLKVVWKELCLCLSTTRMSTLCMKLEDSDSRPCLYEGVCRPPLTMAGCVMPERLVECEFSYLYQAESGLGCPTLNCMPCYPCLSAIVLRRLCFLFLGGSHAETSPRCKAICFNPWRYSDCVLHLPVIYETRFDVSVKTERSRWILLLVVTHALSLSDGYHSQTILPEMRI